MTGTELRAIRKRLGLTQEAFGRALGYQGPNIRKIISRLETGKQAVPRLMAFAVEGMKAKLPGV